MRLELARGDTVRTSAVRDWSPTWSELVLALQQGGVGPKDGPYFTRCSFSGGARASADAGIPYLAIIDADASINPASGETWDGAPPPAHAHEILRGLDITHAIYTSYHHGDKGHRWRAVVPVEMAHVDLPRVTQWLIDQLHADGCCVAPAPENDTIAQPWYFPRFPSVGVAEAFEFYEHDGGQPFPIDEARARLPAKKEPIPQGEGYLPPERIRDLRRALAYIDADDRGKWLRVGMALHSTGAPNAYGVWTEWSMQSEKFNDKGQRRTWASFSPDGGVNIESIFSMAASSGWVNEPLPPIGLQDVSIRSGADLSWANRPAPELDQIVPGWIAVGLTHVLAAPPKLGKTRLASSLEVAVASGTDWLGIELGPPRKVLALHGEDTEAGAHRRFAPMLQRLRREQWARFEDNFFFRPGYGRDSVLVRRDPKTRHVVPTDLFYQIHGFIAASGIELLVIDTLARIHGENELDRAAMTGVISVLEQLAIETSVAVYVLAHTTKGAAQAERLDQMDALSGSTGVSGAFRAIHMLSPMGVKESGRYCVQSDERERFVRLTCAGANDMPEPDPIWIDRSGSCMERVELGQASTKRQAARTDKAEARYAAVLAGIKERLRKAASQGSKCSRREFAREYGGADGPLGVGERQLRGILQTAVERGHLTETKTEDSHGNSTGYIEVPPCG